MVSKRVGKYEIGHTLGEGTFGKVKYAVHVDTNEAVAIKVLDKEKIQQQNMGQQIKKEISIMKVVRHPNIVKLKEVLASRSKIFIVLELVTGGELFDQIVKEGKFTEEKARFYFRQLVHGLEYCNSKGVCHRDLKPENLLLDGKNDLKISDFGLSALYTGGDEETASRTTLLHTTCGTPNYVAPEVLEDKGYDGRSADIWSCGVILYVLLAGFLPFDEPTMPQLFEKIQTASFQFPSWFSEGVRDMLGKILVTDSQARLKIGDIKKFAWFTNNGELSEEAPAVVLETDDIGEGVAGVEDAPPTEVPPTEVPPTEVEADTSATDDAAENNEGGESPLTTNEDAQRWITRTQSESKVKRVFQFKSRGEPAKIVQSISESLTEMECEMKVFEENNKIKACKMTPKGMIGVVLQVYTLEGDLQMVEVRRGKGDIMEYSAFYKDLTQNKIAHLIEEVVEPAE